MKKVVVTGLGVLSCAGNGPVALWSNLAAGKSGLGPVTRVDQAHIATRVAGEIHDFDASLHFGKEIDLMDPFAQMGVYCAREAIADAGLPPRFESTQDGVAPERVGIITGSAMGGVQSEDYGFLQIYAQNATRLHPFSIPRMMANAATSHISMSTGARGVAFTISTACASATHALGEAWRLIRHGAADMVITGGCDAPLTRGVFRAWEAMRVLAPANGDPATACRPFSADRAGLVLAEGAAMFIFEEEEHARRRGARIYAEVAGYGATADAGHITQPSLDGPYQAMLDAMTTGGIRPDELDYINAHGTATKLNDATEIACIKRLLGEHANRVSISSTKSMHGHAMGASGAIELAVVLLAMQHNVVPPTANYTRLDPDCDLDITPNQARPREIRTALSNSFAFGGLNAVLALKKV